MITTIRKRLRKARRKVIQMVRREDFSPPRAPLRKAWITQTAMMHKPSRMPGSTPAMNIAAMETVPQATE